MIDLKREHFAELNEGKKTTHTIQEFTGTLGKLLYKINLISMIKVSEIGIEYTASGFTITTEIKLGHINVVKVAEKVRELYPKNAPSCYAVVMSKKLVLKLFVDERGVDALTY